MARIKKKGTSGSAKNYVTRSQAVRKLQISLGDFRRLCIFKGIYPREPRSKKRVSKSSTPSTTFYYAKDIQYLLHEPLLAKFRDQKALAKKITRALARNEVSGAARLEKNLAPKIRLDHIIKERYPTFVDALRDLDDALSMLYLFANLPSTAEVPAKTVAKCQRLTMEFEHYLIRMHSLRKSFLSIKGIYFQATIQGQDILWIVPYKFVQRAGDEIDFRIMATFVEFYTALLGFVNFRLYTSIGLVYPPKFDTKSDEFGAELGAFQLEGQGTTAQADTNASFDAEKNERAQAEADRLLSAPDGEQKAREEISEVSETRAENQDEPEEHQNGALDTFASIDETADTLLQPSFTADSSAAAQLFEPFTIFLSRETPRRPLEFILKAFGCKRVGWDSVMGEPGSYCSEDDRRITHQVVDRPDLPLPSPPATTDGEADTDDEDGVIVKKSNERVPGRIYIQPQWIWDSVNAGRLQRPDLYAAGATLPPHLSPWVKPKAGEYDPTVSLAEQETAAEAEAADDEEDEDDEADGGSDDGKNGVHQGNDNTGLGGSMSDDEASESEEDVGDASMAIELAMSEDEENEDEGVRVVSKDAEWDGFSEEENDIDHSARETRAHQSELEAEALGQRIASDESQSSSKKKSREAARAKRTKADREAEEDTERRKMMMSRRKRKMYEKMVYSNARKDEEAEKLRAKRRKIENQKSKEKV